MDIAKSRRSHRESATITKVEVKSKASGIVEKWYVDAKVRAFIGARYWPSWTG